MPEPDWSLGGTAPVLATPPPAPTTQPVVPLEAPRAGGREELPAMSYAMRQVESGDRHVNDKGVVITSPKGAIGVSQLMPETAKTLGVDPYNEAQNREGGERLLGQLFDKYGSWEDALVAYNWGEGNTNKWIAAGHDPAKLPAETKAYVPDVLRRAGFQTDLVSKRREPDWDLGGAATVGGTQPTQKSTSLTDALGTTISTASTEGVPVDPTTSAEFAGQAAALTGGAMKGVADLVTGPTQTTLEQVSPGAAASFTNFINQHFEPVEFATARRDHPTFGLIGQIAGTTGALWASRGMMSALPVVNGVAQTVAQTVPAALRGAIAAGLISGTAYRAEPDAVPRWLSGAIGAVIGAAGGRIAEAVGNAARKLSDTTAYQAALRGLGDTVGEMSKNATAPLQAVISRATQLTAETSKRYTAAAGRTGLAPEPFSEILRTPAAASQERGIAAHPAVTVAARRAYDEMGLKAQDAARAEVEAAAARHESELAAWQKKYAPSLAGQRGAAMSPETQNYATQQLISQGAIPPPPVAPPPFVPTAIEPKQLEAGLTAVNRALRSARDPAARTQLKMLSNQLNAEAASQAAAVGQDLPTFLRNLAAANKFHLDNIVPFRRIFGTSNAVELAERFTPYKMVDTIEKVIKSGDVAAARQFAAVVGPRGLAATRRIAQWHMMTDGQPTGGDFVPSLQVKFIRDNQEVLQELFGRDGIETMRGWAKISDRIAAGLEAEKHARGHYSRFVGSFAVVLAAERLGEGIMHGDPFRGVGEAGFILGASWFGHAFARFASRAEQVAGVMPLVRGMSKLPVDSSAFEGRLRQLQQRYMRAVTTAVRVPGQASEEPPRPPAMPSPASPLTQ